MPERICVLLARQNCPFRRGIIRKVTSWFNSGAVSPHSGSISEEAPVRAGRSFVYAPGIVRAEPGHLAPVALVADWAGGASAGRLRIEWISLEGVLGGVPGKSRNGFRTGGCLAVITFRS